MGTRGQITVSGGAGAGRFVKSLDGYPAGVAGAVIDGLRELSPDGSSIDLRTVEFGRLLRRLAESGKVEEMSMARTVGDAAYRYEIDQLALTVKVYNRLPIAGSEISWAPLFSGSVADFARWAAKRGANFSESQN